MEQNKYPSATREVITALQVLMKERMPFLENVYDDFPANNQKLKFPSASIFTGSPTLNKAEPFIVKTGQRVVDEQDENFNKVPVQYCVGSYDFSMQIDFWCESKFQRHDIFEAFNRAFNDVNPSGGVNIKLDKYYDQWIHLDFESPSFDSDSEASSQRGEWRVIARVYGNVRCIVEKMENIMQFIESTTEII